MFGKSIVFISQKDKKQSGIIALDHPSAGYQIPKGTIEPHEDPRDAALREGREETGLKDLTCVCEIKSETLVLGDKSRYVLYDTAVYSRPDLTSFNWAHLSRGIPVRVRDRWGDFTQIEYIEYTDLAEDSPVSYQILGWVPTEHLTKEYKLFYYHLETSCEEETWTNFDDHHNFRFFWLKVEEGHQLIGKHRIWLDEVFCPYLAGLPSEDISKDK